MNGFFGMPVNPLVKDLTGESQPDLKAANVMPLKHRVKLEAALREMEETGYVWVERERNSSGKRNESKYSKRKALPEASSPNCYSRPEIL